LTSKPAFGRQPSDDANNEKQPPHAGYCNTVSKYRCSAEKRAADIEGFIGA
jgi:hypothetical protein